jgi:hypothetical protein
MRILALGVRLWASGFGLQVLGFEMLLHLGTAFKLPHVLL